MKNQPETVGAAPFVFVFQSVRTRDDIYLILNGNYSQGNYKFALFKNTFRIHRRGKQKYEIRRGASTYFFGGYATTPPPNRYGYVLGPSMGLLRSKDIRVGVKFLDMGEVYCFAA